MDGRNPFRTTWKPWLKPLFVGIYRRIIIPGFLKFRPSTVGNQHRVRILFEGQKHGLCTNELDPFWFVDRLRDRQDPKTHAVLQLRSCGWQLSVRLSNRRAPNGPGRPGVEKGHAWQCEKCEGVDHPVAFKVQETIREFVAAFALDSWLTRGSNTPFPFSFPTHPGKQGSRVSCNQEKTKTLGPKRLVLKSARRYSPRIDAEQSPPTPLPAGPRTGYSRNSPRPRQRDMGLDWWLGAEGVALYIQRFKSESKPPIQATN